MMGNTHILPSLGARNGSVCDHIGWHGILSLEVVFFFVMADFYFAEECGFEKCFHPCLLFRTQSCSGYSIEQLPFDRQSRATV